MPLSSVSQRRKQLRLEHRALAKRKARGIEQVRNVLNGTGGQIVQNADIVVRVQ